MHRTFMGTVERGESNLSFQNIARVADALDLTFSALFLGLEGLAEAQPAKGEEHAAPRKRKGDQKIARPVRKV